MHLRMSKPPFAEALQSVNAANPLPSRAGWTMLLAAGGIVTLMLGWMLAPHVPAKPAIAPVATACWMALIVAQILFGRGGGGVVFVVNATSYAWLCRHGILSVHVWPWYVWTLFCWSIILAGVSQNPIVRQYLLRAWQARLRRGLGRLVGDAVGHCRLLSRRRA